VSERYPNEPRVRWDHADLNEFLLWACKLGMSDMLLRSGTKAWMRLHGLWRAVTDRSISADELLSGLERMTRNNSVAALLKSGQKDYDFAHMIDEARGLRQRYRGNATPVADGYSTGVKLVFRTIASEPPPVESLNLEPAILEHAFPENGLVLITGVMGSGKSTLLAALLREIIVKGGRNVATYEAPIEFDFDSIPNPGGPVSQSSIPEHLADFLTAMRNCTRTAPDVVLIGESRDPETMRGMLESAEIGVAAYSTVHSPSVPETLTRILHVFPHDEQPRIAATLLTSLRLIVSQRLLPHPSGEGRTALREYLPFTAEIRETLLETPLERLKTVAEKFLETHGQKLQIPAQTAFDEGTISRERYLGIMAERQERKGKNIAPEEDLYRNSMQELVLMGRELLASLSNILERRPDNGRGSFMEGYRTCAQDFHFGRSRRVPLGSVAFPLGMVDGGNRLGLRSDPVPRATYRHVPFGLRPRRPRGAHGKTPGNSLQRTTMAQTLPLVNRGEVMNTPSRNSHGLYDAPNRKAAREPLALTQDQLQRQLEDGAFYLDRSEAIQKGFLNPYDDETAKVLVQ